MKSLVHLDDFPSRNNVNFQAYCSVSPLSRPAAERAKQFIERQLNVGRGVIFEYSGEQSVGPRFRKNFSALLRTDSGNISMGTSTSESLSMIANGYPFSPGDQIISYINEYPANHYPWVLQAKHRGVELVLLSDAEPRQADRDHVGQIPDSFARSWSMDELESRITNRTRMIAISHVQFTSGFAADLVRLGQLCRDRNIDLVVDAAQSLGSLPLYPDEWGIACVAASGWKWLLGPIGSSVLYTNPAFREKIEITMTGADQMLQDTEYLDHTWAPHTSGRKFEYSTVSYALLDSLSVGVEEIFLPHSVEQIRDYNFAMQDLALEHLDGEKYQPVVHRSEHRSGILSLIPKQSTAKQISAALELQNIIVTPRDGYLRFAPHLCTTADEVLAAVESLNRI